MPELNWGLLKTPDFAGNAFASYAQGQELGRDDSVRRASAVLAANPNDPNAFASLMAVDPQRAAVFQRAARDRVVTAREDKAYDRGETARTTAEPLLAKGDYAGASQAVAGLDPELSAKLAGLGDKERARLKELSDTGGSILMSAIKLPADQRKAYADQQLAGAGLDPAKYDHVNWGDDATLQALATQNLTLSDHLAQNNADRTFAAGRSDADRAYDLDVDQFGETKRSNKVGEGQRAQALGYDGARLGLERQRVGLEAQRVAQTANGGMTPAQTRRTEGDLRKEFDGLPEVKAYRTIRQSANTVQQMASANPSAQGDIAITYATMKAYDPNSVVRETEFATAQNAAGVPDRVRNAWNRLQSGQRLSPKQRADMAASVGAVAKTAEGRFNTIQDQYRGYAGDYGASPDHVAPKAAPTPPAPTNSATGPRGTRDNPFDLKGDPNRAYGGLPKGAYFTGPDGQVRKKP